MSPKTVGVIEVAGVSRQGRRSSNEDFAIYRVPSADGPLLAYAIVCDGMGGHNAGEVASEMAATFLRTQFEDLIKTNEDWVTLPQDELKNRVETWVSEINQRIRQQGEENSQQKGMGTTLALAAILNSGRLLVANVGDSRIFLLRRGTATQISVDHTALAEQRRILNLDPEKRFDMSASPFAHALTRSLGQDGLVLPDVLEEDLESGDVIILTSDGVTDVVEPDAFVPIFESSPNLAAAAEKIYSLAYESGSRDNITVVLLSYRLPVQKQPVLPGPDCEDFGDDTIPLRGPAPFPKRAVEHAPRSPAPPKEPAKAPPPGGSSKLFLGLGLCALLAAAAGLLVFKTLFPAREEHLLSAKGSLPSKTPPPPPESHAPLPEAAAVAIPATPEPSPSNRAAAPEPTEREVAPPATQKPTPAARPEKTQRPAKTPVETPKSRRQAPLEETVLSSGPVEPKEAVLEKIRISIDRKDGNYLFNFHFDRPVSSPKQRDMAVRILHLDRSGEGARVPDLYRLTYSGIEGSILKFRIRIDATEFKNEGTLREGRIYWVTWDDSDRPFPKAPARVRAEVFE